MSWTYQTISKDVGGWCANSEDGYALRDLDRNGWEFVSGFALKAQPGIDERLVMTFRQTAVTQHNNFHPVEISGG